jgi:tripartite-type tricarboxylate transporter receptor subunit TctC
MEDQMFTRRRLAALVLAGLAAPGAGATTFPSRPVRMIVPYPPGGGTDALARPVAEALRAALGQPVVVENRGGAGGNIGMEVAARSAPDGHTIVINADVVTAYPFLYANLPYDLLRDFTPLARIATSTLVLVAHPGLEQTTLPALLAQARRDPASLDFANPGRGTPHHLAFTLLSQRAGVPITQVDYRGNGPALTDVIAGHVKLGVFTLGSITGHLDSGALRPIAVFSAQRHPQRPTVPTVAEAGIDGATMDIGYALWAPAGTPPEIVAALVGAARRVGTDAGLRAQLQQSGFDLATSTPEEAASFLRAESERWGPVLRSAGIRPQ